MENNFEKKRVLVTFDIDGTLIRSVGSSSNRLHRLAFSHAFSAVFGIQDSTIDVVQHHGQTDPLILVKTAEYYGIPSDVANAKLPEMKSKMIEYARDHAKDIGQGLEVLPGVTSLLESLTSNDVVIGLVTGNLDEIAWMKMEGLGIQKYFTVPNFGGFGSDHMDRGELVKIAATRAVEQFGGEFDLRVHVGDTPNDIKAAENGGALAVGVCTVIGPTSTLHEFCINHIYNDHLLLSLVNPTSNSHLTILALPLLIGATKQIIKMRFWPSSDAA